MNRGDFRTGSSRLSLQHCPQRPAGVGKYTSRAGSRGDNLSFGQLAALHRQEAPNSEAAAATAEAAAAAGGSQQFSSSSSQLLLLNEARQPLLPRSPASAASAGAATAARPMATVRRPHEANHHHHQQQPPLHSIKGGRRKIIRRARKNPTVDRIVTLLQDKRIEDDQLEQIQDLQLPLLRKILNVIFISLGVTFLLGVIIVIIYTNIGKDDHSRKN